MPSAECRAIIGAVIVSCRPFVVSYHGWGVGGTVKCETASKSRSSPKPQKCVIRFWNIRTLPCARLTPAKHRHACLCEDDEREMCEHDTEMKSYRKTDLDNTTRLWIIILQRLSDVSTRKLSELPSMASSTIYIYSHMRNSKLNTFCLSKQRRRRRDCEKHEHPHLI